MGKIFNLSKTSVNRSEVLIGFKEYSERLMNNLGDNDLFIGTKHATDCIVNTVYIGDHNTDNPEDYYQDTILSANKYGKIFKEIFKNTTVTIKLDSLEFYAKKSEEIVMDSVVDTNDEKQTEEESEKICIQDEDHGIVYDFYKDLILDDKNTQYDEIESTKMLLFLAKLKYIDEENIFRDYINLQSLLYNKCFHRLRSFRGTLPFERFKIELYEEGELFSTQYFDLTDFNEKLLIRTYVKYENSKRMDDCYVARLNKKDPKLMIFSNANNSVWINSVRIIILNLTCIIEGLLNSKNKIKMESKKRVVKESSNTHHSGKKKTNKKFKPSQSKLELIDRTISFTDKKATKTDLKNRERAYRSYLKESWQRRGHYRHYKNGKVIFIKSAVCKRNEDLLTKEQELIYGKDSSVVYF